MSRLNLKNRSQHSRGTRWVEYWLNYGSDKNGCCWAGEMERREIDELLESGPLFLYTFDEDSNIIVKPWLCKNATIRRKKNRIVVWPPPFNCLFMGKLLNTISEGTTYLPDDSVKYLLWQDQPVHSWRKKIQRVKSEMDVHLFGTLSHYIERVNRREMYKITPFPYVWIRQSRDLSILLP